jgi:hypothetical protein
MTPPTTTTPASVPAPTAPTLPAGGLEAGDTAAPPGAPVEPLAPIVTAPPALEAPLLAPPPPPRRVPFYQRHWFWGAVGVVVVTGMILFAVALSNADPVKPQTRLGDMRAF